MYKLAKKKKIRGSHRGYLTKILTQVSGLVTDFNEEIRADVAQLPDSICETFTVVKNLDDKIVDLMASDAESTEADAGKEIEDTGKVQSDARKTVRRVEARLVLACLVLASVKVQAWGLRRVAWMVA